MTHAVAMIEKKTKNFYQMNRLLLGAIPGMTFLESQEEMQQSSRYAK